MSQQPAIRTVPSFRNRNIIPDNTDVFDSIKYLKKLALLDSLKQDIRTQQQGGFRNNLDVRQSATLPRIGSSNTTTLARDIDRELGSMDLQSRMRDLEILVVDFKGAVERKLQKSLEEQPQRIKDMIKSLEEREAQLRKQSNERMSQLGDTVTLSRDNHRQQLDQLTALVLEVQKKVDTSDYRLQRVEQSQEGLQMKFNAVHNPSQPKQLMIQDNEHSNINRFSATNDVDVRMIRDSIAQEKIYRDGGQQDLMRQYQELNQRFMRQESEFYSRLKAQRDELIEQNQKTRQQVQGLDSLKLQQINKDSEYVKALVSSVEAKVSEEVEKRLRSEFQGKQLIEERLQAFRDEIRNDEKQIIQGEQKLARGVHESITSLNQILKNTREQLEAQAAASQAVVVENLKALSKSLETVRESTTMRVQLVEHAQVELNHRLSESRQMLHDHQSIIAESMQMEFEKQEHSRLAFQSEVETAINQNKQDWNKTLRDNEDWRINFEQKNLHILTEVSSALKSMKTDLKNEHKFTVERVGAFQQEFDQFIKQQEGLTHNIELHMQQVELQLTFKADETLSYVTGQINNHQLQVQLDIDAACETMYEESKAWANKKTFDAEERLEKRVVIEAQRQDLQVKTAVIEVEIRVRDYFAERENVIFNRLEDLIRNEQQQRLQLQKLMAEFNSTVQTFREEVRKEMSTLTEILEYQVRAAVEKLDTEIREKNTILSRQLQEDLVESEHRIIKRVDEQLISFQSQLDQMKIYIDRGENQLKSFMLQQVEQLKFELKSLLKDHENQLFKMKVWLMKQIELINHSMQDMHIHIQSELFMERMYMATSLEQLQLNIEERLDWEYQMRIAYQNTLERQQQTFISQVKSQLDDLKSLVEGLQDHINEGVQGAITQLGFEVGESMGELKGQLDQTYSYFEAKLYLDNVLQQANQAMEQDRQSSLIGKVNKLIGEIERLERKQNGSAVELDKFLVSAETNFNILQEAIKAHTTFLNEIDSRQFADDLISKTQLQELTQGVQQISQGMQQISIALTQTHDYTSGSLQNVKLNLSEQLEQIEQLEQLLDRQEQSNESTALLIKDQSKLLQETISGIKNNDQSKLIKETMQSLKSIDTSQKQMQADQVEFESRITQEFSLFCLNEEYLKTKTTMDRLIKDYNTLMEDLSQSLLKFSKELVETKSEQTKASSKVESLDKEVKSLDKTVEALNQDQKLQKNKKPKDKKVEENNQQQPLISNDLKQELDQIEEQLLLVASLQQQQDQLQNEQIVMKQEHADLKKQMFNENNEMKKQYTDSIKEQENLKQQLDSIISSREDLKNNVKKAPSKQISEQKSQENKPAKTGDIQSQLDQIKEQIEKLDYLEQEQENLKQQLDSIISSKQDLKNNVKKAPSKQISEQKSQENQPEITGDIQSQLDEIREQIIKLDQLEQEQININEQLPLIQQEQDKIKKQMLKIETQQNLQKQAPSKINSSVNENNQSSDSQALILALQQDNDQIKEALQELLDKMEIIETGKEEENQKYLQQQEQIESNTQALSEMQTQLSAEFDKVLEQIEKLEKKSVQEVKKKSTKIKSEDQDNNVNQVNKDQTSQKMEEFEGNMQQVGQALEEAIEKIEQMEKGLEEAYDKIDQMEKQMIKQKNNQSQKEVTDKVSKIENELDEHTEALNQLNGRIEQLEEATQKKQQI